MGLKIMSSAPVLVRTSFFSLSENAAEIKIIGMSLEDAKKQAPKFKVPGSFDMPLAIKNLLVKDNIEGVVCLGAVIKGDTDHDQIVAQHAARKMVDLSLEFNKPVSLGVSGPGMTRIEAVERIEDFARRSVESVVKMVRRLRDSNKK